MTRFVDREPLEFTSPSKIQIIVVCPNCKSGQYVGKNWYSGECIDCGEYFRKEDSLSKEEMDDLSSSSKRIPNLEKIALKTKVEKQAFEYRDKINQQRKQGKVRSHEPGGKQRDW